MAKDGYYAQKFNNIGGFGDVMFNLTNWALGYKPGRFYNAVVYAGMGVHWVFDHTHKGDNPWKYAGGHGPSRNFSARAGLLNTFRLSNRFNFLVDLRFEEIQEHIDGYNKTWTEYPSALLGISYKFGKTEWNAPVVPVCPELDTRLIDDLRNKLEEANRNIADLKQQLQECLNRKVTPPAPKEEEAPLAVIYYPINVSKIVGVQKDVANACAEVMKSENSNYVLTGWADNYTGNDQINTRLRKERVAGAKAAFIKKGVEANRMDTQINDGNRINNPKAASLSRAVTITRAK